jgi:hypothetical protein
MPTTRPVASPLRPALLAVALAAALPIGCGGSSPRCDLPPMVTADQAWQVFGPAEWPAACGTLTVDVPALAAGERAALLLVNAGAPDGAASVSLAGTFGLADAAPAPLAAQALDPAAATTTVSERSALDEGHALVVERRRAATEAWLAEGAPAPVRSVTAGLLAPAAAPQVGDLWKDPRGPCVYSYSDGSIGRRLTHLRHISANALFYVTDDVWGGFQNVIAARPDFWATLESYFEGTASTRNPSPVTRRILPALHEAFGQESDADGNGKLIFLFADLGRSGTSGFTVGYFFSPDVARAADTSANCRDPVAQGSNGADMLYLLDPCTFNRNGILPTPASCDASGDGGGAYPYSRVVDQEVPGTMAHELQHLVQFQTRCRPDLPAAALPSCAGIDDPARDLWLNEGLAMASEDFAGFGLGGAGERSRMAVYLNCVKSGSALCHQDVSLTTWPSKEPGNPSGHYGGAHAFVRWHADQATAGRARADLTSAAALTKALVGSGKTSRAAVADVSGRAFEEGYARFATAALFSGEDPLFTTYPVKPAPAFSFASGVPWSPLHQALTVTTPQNGGGSTLHYGYVAYGDLSPAATPATPLLATLRRDGWRSYVTRQGSGTDVQLTVTSTAAVKPRAVVVRFKGTLPLP